ncbi:MAG: DUF6151 family protein [Polyangiales bacterium]
MDLTFRCRCGALQGVVRDASPTGGHRAICYCDDCQTAAHALDGGASLDEHGGSDIFQVPPRSVSLTQGVEHLRCLRLGPKGLLRWYAGCCDTPLANCLPTPRSPFVGVQAGAFVLPEGASRDDALGPVRLRVMGAYAKGGCPPGAAPRFRITEGGPVARLLLRSVLRGLHRPSPFFDPSTGAMRATPRVLTREARNEARAKAGQPPLPTTPR